MSDVPIYGAICKYPNIFFGKKSLNVPTVKLFSIFFFQMFWDFFNAFLLGPLIKGKQISIGWVIICYCMQIVPQICNNSKFNKKKEMNHKWLTSLIQ